MKETFKIECSGRFIIKEYETLEDALNKTKGKVILAKSNAVHPEHAALMLARAAADRPDGSIYTMWFGSGGASVDPLGNIVYATPNTSGAADLNDPQFYAIVDDNQGAPAGNSMSVLHINGSLLSTVEITCVVTTVTGQPQYDNLTGTNLNNSNFVFNELGLKTADDLLITHAVFAPVVKSANRVLGIYYTLEFSLVT